ncbi:MAG: phenylacetate--CoA ligase family protein [Halioglobus sp.]|nr:phenylacetate--CoA ligase family protein [Halioglobus sp.]
MSLYTQIAANVLFPLHERIKGHSTIEVFRAMEESQWYTPEQMQELQVRRLRDFLARIGSTVPYYRSLFERLNFNPADLASVAELQQLPLMGKPEIRANTDALKAVGAVDLQRFNTGGSSGEPLIFFLGKERVSHDVAAKRRATRWWDVDIGDTEIVVWGSPIELGSQDRIRRLRDGLFRTSLLPAFEMSERNLDRFVAEILRTRPRMLFGYPSSLHLIARHARGKGVTLDNIGIKVAFVTSERLYDYQREEIEAVFGCRVANGYGGRDAGFIAHECPAGNFHITAEDVIVEIVDEAGQVLPHGETGEIVVTHLATGDYPFVRYRTGDVGALTRRNCECGRGLPLLEELQGRTTDFVIAEDGSHVHGLALIYVLRDLPGISSFKITQHSQQAITVQIVRDDEYDPANESEIRAVFRARLGAGVLVDVEYVDAIAREKSGKFRYIVSHVQR